MGRRGGWLAAAAVLLCATAMPATALPAAALPRATPGPVTVTDPRIVESSGLVLSPTVPSLVWTVNDSGGSPTLYGVSRSSGRTRAVLTLAGTEARDWEALTATRTGAGRGLLWVGDVGDNRAVRTSVVIRLLVEPPTLSTATATKPLTRTIRPLASLRVRYPDGPQDVETMIWTPDGRLLLVSKDLLSAVVYQVPPRVVAAALSGQTISTPALAVRIATVQQSLVTDGAALPDGRIILRGYQGATIYPDPRDGADLEPLQSVRLPSQPQGETLAVVDAGAAVLVGSEGVRQPLYQVQLSRPTATSSQTTSAPAGASATDRPSTPVAAGSGDGTVQRSNAPAVLFASGLLGAAALMLAVVARRRRQR